MDIGEVNNLQTDNIATNFNASPNNVETSDELSLAESFFAKQDTNYATKKREDDKNKKTVTTLTLGATAILSTFIFANSYLPTLPKVNDISQTIVEGSLQYSFNIVGNKKYALTYLVSVNDETFYETDVSENAHYEGKVDIASYSLSMKISTSITARFSDYRRNVGEYIIQGGSL